MLPQTLVLVLQALYVIKKEATKELACLDNGNTISPMKCPSPSRDQSYLKTLGAVNKEDPLDHSSSSSYLSPGVTCNATKAWLTLLHT